MLGPVLVFSGAVFTQKLRDAAAGSRTILPSLVHGQRPVQSCYGSNSVFILLLRVGIGVPGDCGRNNGSGFSLVSSLQCARLFVSCTLTLGW